MNLAKDPIPLLVRRIAFPASVGWFFITTFNVVDNFWAGQLSAQAIAALSLSMIPFWDCCLWRSVLDKEQTRWCQMHWEPSKMNALFG